MTGADLPNASRRADGLATSSALRNQLQTNTRKLSQAIPTDAAMISKQPKHAIPDVPTVIPAKAGIQRGGDG